MQQTNLWFLHGTATYTNVCNVTMCARSHDHMFTGVVAMVTLGPGSGVSGGEVTEGSWKGQEHHHFKIGIQGKFFWVPGGNSLVPRLIFFFRKKKPGYEAKRGGLFYHINDMKIYRPQSCYNWTKWNHLVVYLPSLLVTTVAVPDSSHSLRVYFASLFLLSSCCQVTEYYTQVHRSLEVEPCNVINKKHKDWLRLLKIKIHYFQAMSHVSCEG